MKLSSHLLLFAFVRCIDHYIFPGDDEEDVMLLVPLEEFNTSEPMQIKLLNPSGENPVILVFTKRNLPPTDNDTGNWTCAWKFNNLNGSISSVPLQRPSSSCEKINIMLPNPIVLCPLWWWEQVIFHKLPRSHLLPKKRMQRITKILWNDQINRYLMWYSSQVNELFYLHLAI